MLLLGPRVLWLLVLVAATGADIDEFDGHDVSWRRSFYRKGTAMGAGHHICIAVACGLVVCAVLSRALRLATEHLRAKKA